MAIIWRPPSVIPGVPNIGFAPDLDEGQYSLDNFVIGRGTAFNIESTTIDPVAFTTQDQSPGSGDGMRFGTDYVTSGKVYTFTGNVLTPGDGIGSLDAYAQLEAYWNNTGIRLNPGAVSTLRFRYVGSPVTRRVYGRGRQCAQALGQVSQGRTGFVAAFQAADGSVYGDDLNTITAGVAGTLDGTVIPNLLSNPKFTNGTTGYSTTGGTLVSTDTSIVPPGAANCGKFTPDGVTANPQVTGPATTVITGRTYAANLSSYLTVTPSVPLVFRILAYDASLTFLNVLNAVTITSTAHNQWVPDGLSFTVPNNGTRWVALQLIYTGTPTAASIVRFGNSILGFTLTGTTLPMTGPFRALGSVTSALGVPIVNAGTLDTWPTLIFQGPITNPLISLIDIGAAAQILGNVPDGTTITIDTAPWARQITDQSGKSWAGSYNGNALGEFIVPPGITNWIFSGQDSTGKGRCTLQWRTAHATIGGTNP